MNTRRRIFPAFLLIIVFSLILYGTMIAIESHGISVLFSYEKLEQLASKEFLYTFLWFLGDMTEAQFYKSFLGGTMMIIFAFIAHLLYKRRSKFAGFSISYGSGLWPWVFVAAAIGLAISIALYGHWIDEGWVPTFVPFVSIPGAIVLIYGGGWKNTLTGSILGGLIGFPIAWFVISILLDPIEMHGVVGNVTGMWLGGIIVFEICNHLPWMKKTEEEQPEPEEKKNDHEEQKTKEDQTVRGNKWFIRRVLADFTEAQFYANEWASIGLLLGVIITWLLNPFHVSYGSGLLPALLLSQFLTLAIANLLYYDKWDKFGWYPTFVPVVSVAPAVVLTFGGTMFSIFAGAVLGAIIGPPVAQMIINKSPNHWHPVVGNTFSMALSTLLVITILRYLPIF